MYKAVIVGCGSIGALKPSKFDRPGGDAVLTHAHAIYNHPEIELMGVVDTNEAKAWEAAEKWETIVYDQELDGPVHIAIIATPTSTHHIVFAQVLERLHPQIVIMEKPMGIDAGFCNMINEMVLEVPIAVNYARRYELYHQMMKDKLDKDCEVIGCRVTYGRGLMHDGCHALDLMNWWFGKLRWSSRSNGLKEPEFDMSHGFMAGYERCPQVVFTPVDSKDYGVFEIEVLTDKGKYEFRHNGTEFHTRWVVVGDGWGDYPVLGPSYDQKTTLRKAMTALYNNVVGFLDGKEELLCTSKDALAVWEAYNKIVEDK